MGHSDVESVDRVIEAPPEAIFALLADPQQHQRFDGSGLLRDASSGSRRLELGSRFGMSMRAGMPYSTVNVVVEFTPDRLIAWQTKAPGVMGKLIGGRIWRFELEPTSEGTRVRQSWDISQEAAVSRPVVRRMADMTRRNMARSLERIERLVV